MAYIFEQALALLLPFIIGLLIGYILKQSLKLLAALVILILVLLIAGIIDIGFLEAIFRNILAYGAKATEAAKSVASILPFSSIIFLAGVAIGFLISR